MSTESSDAKITFKEKPKNWKGPQHSKHSKVPCEEYALEYLSCLKSKHEEPSSCQEIIQDYKNCKQKHKM